MSVSVTNFGGEVQAVHTVYPLDYDDAVKLFDLACFDKVMDPSGIRRMLLAVSWCSDYGFGDVAREAALVDNGS